MTLLFGAGIALVLAGAGTYWTVFLREAPQSPAEIAASLPQASAAADTQKKALDDLRRAAERDEAGLPLRDKDPQKNPAGLTSRCLSPWGFAQSQWAPRRPT